MRVVNIQMISILNLELNRSYQVNEQLVEEVVFLTTIKQSNEI